MSPGPSTVPAGYHAVTPWVIGQDTAGLIDFLVEVFDGTELDRMTDETGQIWHAEVRIHDSVVMMFDKPDWPPTPAFLRVYVPDAVATHDRAVAAGASSVTEPTHMPWGEIAARIRDPYGNVYWLHQRVEDVDDEEVARRFGDPTFIENVEYAKRSLTPPTGST